MFKIRSVLNMCFNSQKTGYFWIEIPGYFSIEIYTPLIDPNDKGILKVTQNDNQYIVELSFHDEAGILYLKYLNDQVSKVRKYPVGISEIE